MRGRDVRHACGRMPQNICLFFACTQTAQQRQLLAEGLEKNQRLGELVMGLQAALGLECRLPDFSPAADQQQQQQTSPAVFLQQQQPTDHASAQQQQPSPHHHPHTSFSRLNPAALPTQQLPPLTEQGALPSIPPLILYGPQGDPMFLAVTSEHPSSSSSSPAGAAPPQRHFRLTPLSAHQAHK